MSVHMVCIPNLTDFVKDTDNHKTSLILIWQAEFIFLQSQEN